jgi:hypothetical protein
MVGHSFAFSIRRCSSLLASSSVRQSICAVRPINNNGRQLNINE